MNVMNTKVMLRFVLARAVFTIAEKMKMTYEKIERTFAMMAREAPIIANFAFLAKTSVIIEMMRKTNIGIWRNSPNTIFNPGTL